MSMITLDYLKRANRAQLVKYLTEGGRPCSAKETTGQLREAAILNFRTEKA